MKQSITRTLFGHTGAIVSAVILTVTSIPFTHAGTQEAAAASKQSSYELVDDVQDGAILHCWNWSYKTIEDNMELIAECGYSAVQTSPASQPKDYTYEGVVGTDVGTPGVGGSGNWWKLYQPVAFSVCDNGQTWLGTKVELQSMCAKAEEYGIKVIVDIVANHMGNITGWKNSLSDVSPQVGTYWNPEMLTDESYWHINDAQVWMSDGRMHFTQGTMGMPDLNTADKRVQGYISNFLDELIDCGVDGFRFDAAKHIETPDDDPAFASDFWPTVLNEAKSHYKAANSGKALYVYGEILNTVGDNFSIDSYTKYMSVTDNSAGNHLLEAFRNYNLGTLGMDYAPEVSVLWAESHDTFMNESSRYASDKSIVRTWAMVANKDNAASLFFVRPYYSYEILEDDTDGRMKSNLEATLNQAQMGECPTYIWASKEVAAINHFNNRMKDASDEMGTDGNIAYCRRGNGIVLANFSGSGSVSLSAHGLANGTYKDEVSGNTFTVSGGILSGTINSEYGVAVIYQNVMPNPSTNYPVQIRANKGDGTVFYSDGMSVTISADYADTASYTVSTGEKGSFQNSATITVGKNLKKGDSVTLTVTGSNSRGSLTKSYTYYKDEYDLTNCIFFQNTSGWNSVNAYMWNDTVTPAVTNAGWPGEAMYECDPDKHIYAVKVDPSKIYTKIIFSSNGASQTADLAMGQLGYLYDFSSNTWSKYGTVVDPTESETETETKKETESEKETETTASQGNVIYLNTNNCSWFESDSAVAAISVDGGKTYTKMTTYTNGDGVKLYLASIQTGTTSVKIARMLPSGLCYNEKTITIENGKDYYVSDGNWNNVTASVYTGSKPVQETEEEVKKFSFTDVKKTAWYYSAVKEVYELGLMTGMTETTFAPSEPMTRAMVATVLYRMAGNPTTTYQKKFPDVPAGKYYSIAVTWAAQNGVVSGYGDGKFKPGTNVTREQMVKMLYNYAEMLGMDTSGNADLTSYKDGKQVSSWAKEPMRWAIANGILSGTTTGELKAKNDATRAEVAKMLLNFYQLLEK